MNPIQQGFSWWCFANRGVADEALMDAAAQIGYGGVDLIEEGLWALATKKGLKITAVDGHASLADGVNHPANAARIEAELHAAIKKAAHWKIPVLVCFSGYRNGVTDEAGLLQSAAVLKRVAPEAERNGVVLAMELLNSRVDHPGYQADRTSWGLSLCERVSSPAFKLLYDIYHMQVMEGDVIRTIQRHHARFAHYHTAGNPGRGLPDATQELNYPAIYRAIARTGYAGFIAHEFIPSGDPVSALRQAFADCRASLEEAPGSP